MLKPLILAFLFVATYFAVSEGCSCIPYDPLRSLRIYCTADWVAEVTVTDVKEDGQFFEFSINYTTVYKMPSKYENNYPRKIYSNQQSAACGVKLSKNREYLLVGNENEGTWQGPAGTIGINSCSYLDQEFDGQLRNNSTAIDCSNFKKE